MSTHDMNIANQGFPAFRADLNNALAALVSNSSSATEPTTTFAYQFWADTGNDLLKQRNAANDGWVSILTLSTGEPVTGGTPDKIEEGNSSIEIVDTGTGYAAVVIDGVERARFDSDGLSFPDNRKLLLGASDDLQIYHDGSHSYIRDAGTGDLIVRAGTRMLVQAADGATTGAIFNEDGSVQLNHNNSKKLETTSTGVDVTGTLKFDSGYGSVATAYGCRAWVNFNGTGTVAISGSGNVSSITDNGTGDYTVNFTTAMPDTNYNTVTSGKAYNNATMDIVGGFGTGGSAASNSNATASVRIACAHTYTGNLIDYELINVSIFR